MTVTNNHLKTSINQIDNFCSNNTNPPEDMFSDFILELRVSNLLIPVIFDGDEITFPHIVTDEGQNLLPLFSDLDEFMKYKSEFFPLANELFYYVGLVNDLKLDGIIINCENERFCIDNELLSKLEPLVEIDHSKGFDEAKLKQIAETLTNGRLVSFIGDDANYNKFDALKELLRQSVLLSVVFCDEELDNGEEMLERDAVGGFVFMTSKVGTENYGLLFTGLDAINQTIDKSEANYRYQIANLYEVIRFILTGDMDGIIINRGREEYFIPRNILLEMFDSDIINADLGKASDYAFML